jgi:hypothetical protein
MPDLIFLALENPLGLIGTKIKGAAQGGVIDTENDLKPLETLKAESLAAKFMIADFKKTGKKDPYKYLNRYRRMEEDDSTHPDTKENPKILPTFVKDTVENRKIVLDLLTTKIYPAVRVAMCSSINSTLNYIQNYINLHAGDQFDTLILFGHGSPGSINMGLSKFNIGPAKKPEDDGYDKRKFARETFGLDKPRKEEGAVRKPLRVRSLNQGTASDFFTQFKQCFDNGCFVQNIASKHFHLFLMGCEVGKKNQTFTMELATLIAEDTGLPMCVSAPTKEINQDHLFCLLDNLDQFRETCAKGISCKLRVVPLESHTASAQKT